MANPSRLVLDMQIVMPCGELQVHVAKDNGFLRDGLGQNLENLKTRYSGELDSHHKSKQGLLIYHFDSFLDILFVSKFVY